MKKLLLLSLYTLLLDTATAQRFVNSYNTVAEMIASPSLNSVSTNINALGYRRAGDGGGGEFVYDKNSIVATNLGTVFKPTLLNGRLLKVYGGIIDPLEFGADASGLSDSTDAIKSAINFASRPTYGWGTDASTVLSATPSTNGALVLRFSTGAYYTTDTIDVYGVQVEGKLSSSPSGNYNCDTLIHSTHGGPCFRFIYGGTNAATGLVDYRVGGIKNIALIGYAETYQQNKKDILAVTDRTHFFVAPGDVPTLDTSEDTVNWCFFYSNEGQYLGAGMVGLVDSGTGEIRLFDGTDVYASVGGFLRTVDKVVFSPRYNNECAQCFPQPSGPYDFTDPGSAGASGIYIQNGNILGATIATGPVVEHVYIDGFHTGIRLGVGILECRFNDVKIFASKFTGISMCKEINTTDTSLTGFHYVSGFYRPDYGPSGSVVYTNTLDNVQLANTTLGMMGWGPAIRAGNVLLEWCAYAQLYVFRSVDQHISDLFLDGCIRNGLVINRGFNTPGILDRSMTINNLTVRTTFSDTPGRGAPDEVHPNSRYAVKINSLTVDRRARLNVNNFSVANLGSGEFTSAFYIPAGGASNEVQISQIAGRTGCVTNAWYVGQPPLLTGVANTLMLPTEIKTGISNPGNDIMAIVVGTTNAIYVTRTNVLVQADLGAFPFSMARDDGTQVDFGLGAGSFYTRMANLDSYATALIGSSSGMSMFIGSPAATTNLRTTQITGETPLGGILTNTAPKDMFFNVNRGTGTNDTGGRLIFNVSAMTAADATSVQALVPVFYIKRGGAVRYFPLSAAPTVNVEEGDVYFDSSLVKLRVRAGGAWVDLH